MKRTVDDLKTVTFHSFERNSSKVLKVITHCILKIHRSTLLKCLKNCGVFEGPLYGGNYESVTLVIYDFEI